jgi:hypothetical protein
MKRALFSLVVIALTSACEVDGGGNRRRDAGRSIFTDAPGLETPDAYFERADIGPLPDAPPLPGDTDGDGIPDADEARYGTDPSNPDTDGDGLGDGVEVLAETDPTDRSDRIPDTDFYVVLPYMEAPTHRPLDFRARLGRADIFFLVDTTGSMGAAITNVTTSLSTTIVPAVNDAIADAVMGVGDYRDFPVDPHGDPGDWAFQIRQTMTSDLTSVQTALRGLRAGGGNDGPESATEGLFRSASNLQVFENMLAMLSRNALQEGPETDGAAVKAPAAKAPAAKTPTAKTATDKKEIELPKVRAQPAAGFSSVGRNDPCPCGSGKKFKNCHGA